MIRYGSHSIRKNMSGGTVSGIFVRLRSAERVSPAEQLIYGMTYKIFTGAKLSFGLALTVVFCGVPEIYVCKKPPLLPMIP